MMNENEKKKTREHHSLPHCYCQAAGIVWRADFLFDLFFLSYRTCTTRGTALRFRKTQARPSILGLTVLLRCGGHHGDMFTRQAEDAG